MFTDQLKHLFCTNLDANRNKDLLVIGNGRSVNKLDINKVISELKVGTLEVAVVNSFFNQKKIVFPDIPGIKFFYLDTHILPAYNKPQLEIQGWLDKRIAGAKDAVERSIYSNYISGSIYEDLRSIEIAIERENTEVFMHPKFPINEMKNVNFINILRYQHLSIFFAPLLERSIGKFTLSNYFGGNVVGSSIMYGIDHGYKNVFVIGHMGKFEYCQTNTWKINYRYFYDEYDRWYERHDDLKTFGFDYLNDRVKQFNLPKYIKSRVKFLGDDHDNYALISKKNENERFLDV